MNPGARYRGPWTGALDRIKVWGRSLVCVVLVVLEGRVSPFHCARTDTTVTIVCTVGGWDTHLYAVTGHRRLCCSHSCMCCNGSACTEPSCVIRPA